MEAQATLSSNDLAINIGHLHVEGEGTTTPALPQLGGEAYHQAPLAVSNPLTVRDELSAIEA